jgi:hypothetical protein
MRTEESPVAYVARQKRGNRIHSGEMGFTPNVYVRAARGIWTRKTAEHWAAAAGVTPRMAKFWLAGTHDVSPAGKLAIIQQFD